MNFLDQFSLTDVTIVFIGLVIVSIVRIWYDAHVNRKKAAQFGNSLGIYNTLLDDTKEGLFILSDKGQLISSNIEATDILDIKAHHLDEDYLGTLIIEDDDNQIQENLLHVIHTKTYIPNAHIVNNPDAKAISISINKVNSFELTNQTWYVVILQDLTQLTELKDGARNLLAA